MIHIFNRQCYLSLTRPEHLKFRPSWFSKSGCYKNLIQTTLSSQLHIVYDEHYGSVEETFLKDVPVEKIINRGKESGSFLDTLEFVINYPDLQDDDIIYFLEDDYVHQPGWEQVLEEAFSIPGISYATLYDHGDKYGPMYPNLRVGLLTTTSSHWMVTPSTTNTFAVRLSTLREDQDIHKYFSENFEPTNDHQKFLELERNGRYLVSSIPGYSTHCNTEFMSPVRDWSIYGSQD